MTEIEKLKKEIILYENLIGGYEDLDLLIRQMTTAAPDMRSTDFLKHLKALLDIEIDYYTTGIRFKTLHLADLEGEE